MNRVCDVTGRSSPQLLVSVRNAQEAADALLGGADIIDIKEPARGSLGLADREQVEQVLQEVRGRRPVSMACGELIDGLADGFAVPLGVQFVKFGLSRCSGVVAWQAELNEIHKQLPPDVQLVPVAYADWLAAQSPEPGQVLQCAAELGSRTMLIDTHQKDGRQLFDCCSFREIVEIVQAAQAIGITIAVAGGLRSESLAQASGTGADIIGVRGAVCDDGRAGRLQVERVRSARRVLAQAATLRFAAMN